ncbi:Uma2 family endonuclease [Singulisphaera rosea]
MAPGLVRIPDVSFIAWERLPDRQVPAGPVLKLAPDLAVEVLSPSNTSKEMERKLLDYFEGGVRLVWYVDPALRSVRTFQAPDRSILRHENQVPDGGAVLPGLAIPIRTLFARLGPSPAH